MRALGLVPLASLTVAAIVNLRAGTPATLLWVCNVCNGLLALSLFTRWTRGLWIATLWLIAGLPLWLLDVFLGGELTPHSFLTHFLATGVGLFALRGTRPPRGLWWQAVLFVVSLQLVTRALASPAGNINVAFTSYHSLARLMPSFAASWIVNVLAFALLMMALEAGLGRLYGVTMDDTVSASAVGNPRR